MHTFMFGNVHIMQLNKLYMIYDFWRLWHPFWKGNKENDSFFPCGWIFYSLGLKFVGPSDYKMCKKFSCKKNIKLYIKAYIFKIFIFFYQNIYA
jgi:hypothetical protein